MPSFSDQNIAWTLWTLYLLFSVKLSAFKDLRARIRIFTGCLLSVIKRSRLYFYGLTLVKHFSTVYSSCLILVVVPCSCGSGQKIPQFGNSVLRKCARKLLHTAAARPDSGRQRAALVFTFWDERWRDDRPAGVEVSARGAGGLG